MREYCIECGKKLPTIQLEVNTNYILGSSIEIIDNHIKICTYCGKKQKIGEKVIFKKTIQELELEARKNIRETNCPDKPKHGRRFPLCDKE